MNWDVTESTLYFDNLLQNIIDGAAACEEVKRSKKLSKILELILLFGNYMNSGSRNGQAFAFEMSFLPKVKNFVGFIVNYFTFFVAVLV